MFSTTATFEIHSETKCRADEPGDRRQGLLRPGDQGAGDHRGQAQLQARVRRAQRQPAVGSHAAQREHDWDEGGCAGKYFEIRVAKCLEQWMPDCLDLKVHIGKALFKITST